MSVLRNLIVRVGADLSNFEQRMAQMRRTLRNTSKNLEKHGKEMTKLFTAPILAGAGAVALFTKSTMDYADKIDKMSIRTGIATDELQKLDFITSQVGVNFESVQKTISKLTINLSNIDKEGDAVRNIMQKLRVETKNTDGTFRKASDIFNETIVQLSRIENPINRSQIAFKLFGKQFEEMLPLLALSESDLQDLSNVFDKFDLGIDQEQINKFVILQDKVDLLGRQFNKIKYTIADAFFPVTEKLFNFIQQKATPTITKFANWFRNLNDTVKINISIFAGILAILPPLMVVFDKIATTITTLNAKWIFLTLGIASAIMYFQKLYKESANFREMVNKIATYIQILVKNFIVGFTELYNRCSPIIDNFATYFKSTFILSVQFVEKVLAWMVGKVENDLENGTQRWSDVWQSWSDLSNVIFFGFFDGVITAFDTFWNYIFEKTDNGINWLKEKMNKIPFFEFDITDNSSKFKKAMDVVKKGFEWMKKTAGLEDSLTRGKKLFEFDFKSQFNIEDIENGFFELLNAFKDINLELLDTDDYMNNITDAIKKGVDAMRNQIRAFTEFTSAFERFTVDTLSPRRLMSRLQGQIRIMTEHQKNMAMLREQGINTTLLSELEKMGFAGAGITKGISRMSSDQLQQYSKLFEQRYDIGTQEAMRSIGTQQQIERYIEQEINISISNSNIKSDDDVNKVVNEIVRKLKLAGVR
jgi:hypothetical protein